MSVFKYFKCLQSSDLDRYSFHHMQINITATLGTLNVAAEVDEVKIKGDGEMHMTLSSRLLPNMNRQLQFVTYTNTLFHPSTADTGEPSETIHRLISSGLCSSVFFSKFHKGESKDTEKESSHTLI